MRARKGTRCRLLLVSLFFFLLKVQVTKMTCFAHLPLMGAQKKLRLMGKSGIANFHEPCTCVFLSDGSSLLLKW